MRTNSFYLSFIYFFLMGFGFYGCKGIAKSQHDSRISNEDLQLLKSRTAVFVLPESENAYFEDYKRLLTQIWTLTPIEVVKYSDLVPYTSKIDKYAFLNISGEETTVRKQSGLSYTITHFYLTISLTSFVTHKNKTEESTTELSRIELYPDNKTMTHGFTPSLNNYIYTSGVFRNFRLPYMVAHLRFMQNNLQLNKNPIVFDNYNDDILRGKLKDEILYVPKDFLYDKNKFSGKETLKDESFFKNYKGKYKYVTIDELISIMENHNSSQPLFLFEYVLSSANKYVNVLDVSTGTYVYRRVTPLSYNLKEKDIDNIVRF